MTTFNGRAYKTDQGVLNLEAEANHFALCLLMPEKQFREVIKEYPPDPSDDSNVKAIAKRFEVSMTAVMFRFAILYRAEKEQIY